MDGSAIEKGNDHEEHDSNPVSLWSSRLDHPAGFRGRSATPQRGGRPGYGRRPAGQDDHLTAACGGGNAAGGDRPSTGGGDAAGGDRPSSGGGDAAGLDTGSGSGNSAELDAPSPAAFSRAGSRAPRTPPRPKRRRQRRTPLTCVKQPRIAESGVFVFFPGKSAGHSGTAEVH